MKNIKLILFIATLNYLSFQASDNKHPRVQAINEFSVTLDGATEPLHLLFVRSMYFSKELGAHEEYSCIPYDAKIKKSARFESVMTPSLIEEQEKAFLMYLQTHFKK